MSEARDRYEKVDPWKENNRAVFIDYIQELEQQNKELRETLDIAIDILSDCNYNFILGKEVLEKYK